MRRRGLLAAALAAPAVARAESGTVRVVCPQRAGGLVDTAARLLFGRVTELLGRPFLVENRPGASGTIGTAFAAAAAADGLTLLHEGTGFALNPALFHALPYDPRRAFQPVFLAMVAPVVLSAWPMFPVATVAQTIARARTEPQGLDCATAMVGSVMHITLELFNRMAGTQMVAVPYRNPRSQRADLRAGRVPLMFGNAPAAVTDLGTGTLRVLAHGGREPVVALSGIPMIRETLPGFESEEWNGVFAPAGTPGATIAEINAGLNAAIAEPAIAGQLLALGAMVRSNAPDAFAAFLDAEAAHWGEAVRATGIRLD